MTRPFAIAATLLMTVSAVVGDAQPSPSNPIPKVWSDRDLETLEVPLAIRERQPHHAPADYYYRIPIRPVYKTYPVYAPGAEPAGYLDHLKQLEPEIVFDPGTLKTREDWTAAGKLVFENPIATVPVTENSSVRKQEYYDSLGIRTINGVNPFQRYLIREKGKVELGLRSCAECHTRVLDDNRIVVGAQSNFPIARAEAFDLLQSQPSLGSQLRRPRFRLAFPEADITMAGIIGYLAATPAGVVMRHRTRFDVPVQVPDLIGVEERKYLDRTGLQHHNSIVDMMRYAALNQGGDELGSFGGLIPAGPDGKHLPEPGKLQRYSDEQLYAMSLYIYSLRPPPNPNPLDAAAKRGRQVFQSAGCAACHPAPLYTNNKLTPAIGFQPVRSSASQLLQDVLQVSVGTDPRLTMQTLRGTGYYKVPSLKGVWYRGPFEHSGSVATLEDWFDPRRLQKDYQPTGYKGYGVERRAVPGHEYGLDLKPEQKKALIAFLKTL